MNILMKNFRNVFLINFFVLLSDYAISQPQISLRMVNAIRTENTLTWDIEIRNSGTGTINYLNGSIHTLTTNGLLPAGTLNYNAGSNFPGLSCTPQVQNSGSITRLRLNADQPINVPISNSYQLLASLTFNSPTSLPNPVRARLNEIDITPRIEITGLVDGIGVTFSIFNGNLVIESSNDIAFPVKLGTFNAEKQGDYSALLNWETYSETNSSHFVIERSNDALDFQDIGSVDAAGQSTTLKTYEFIDKSIPQLRTAQILYYRLRMVDLDGSYEFSDIRGVNFGKNWTDKVRIYPNPTSEILNVDLSELDFDKSHPFISLLNAEGKTLMSKEVLGNGIETIDMTKYAAGIYQILVKTNDEFLFEKVVHIE